MRINALAFGAAATALVVGGCKPSANQTSGNPPAAQTSAARQAAGDKTIAAGLAGSAEFMTAAKAAGLDQTLSGPGPYTVLVPDDAAFAKLPPGTYDNWTKPAGRAQLTGVLTYHILPGTVLADDIGKAIDNAKGKATLATMGGGLLTATRQNGKIVLTDAAGNSATITQADDKFSNGVVHHIDGVLMPKKI